MTERHGSVPIEVVSIWWSSWAGSDLDEQS